MKKNLVLIIILFLYIPLSAQINKNGIPLIKNYSPNDYNASEQNWSICEDKRGVIYVGNTLGILEFDGNNWNLIQLSNGSIAQSLANSEDGTIYVGGVEEFGYLAPDISGRMHYNTLTNQLDSIDFKEILKIYTVGNDVYFCSVRAIFKFSNKRFNKAYKKEVGKGSFLSFEVNNEIYWGSYYESGLYINTENDFEPALGGDFYLEKDIFVMLPWEDNEILIATSGQGIYIYNPQTGLSKSLNALGSNYNDLYNLLDQSQIYNGIKLSNGNYALATLNNGCIVFNNQGEVLYKLDKDNGLTDYTIINLYETKDGNLWLGVNNGISYVEINAPFTRLGYGYGLENIVRDVIRFNKRLFVSTFSGAYYLEYTEERTPQFNKIASLDLVVWCMESIRNPSTNNKELWLGTVAGVYDYTSGNLKKISDLEYESRILYQSKFDSQKVYIGYRNGLALLEYENGKWIDKEKQAGISVDVNSIIEDNDGKLWLGTTLSGVIRINEDNSVDWYGLEDGLPEMGDNNVYYINNKVVCSTKNGIYYLSESNEFKKFEGFGEKYLLSNEPVRNIYSEKENEYWITSLDPNTNFEYIEKVSISQDRIVTIEDVPFKRLLKNTFQEIAFDGDNGVWIATADAIYNYKEQLHDDFAKFYNSLIRKVEIGIDSVVFWGTFYKDTSNLIVHLNQPDQLKNIVKYKNNSFNFFFSTPFVPTDEVNYSYMLEGFDKTWSSWEVKTERGYTNLNQGSYTFMVKAKNIYGIESEIISYEFTIKPPWYKTIWAYLFYLVAAIFVIMVIVKIYTRRLELEKIRLEQIVKERTEEVVKQKDEIADKNRSITDSIKYAERIQKAILPSDEYAKEILPEHFILFRPRDIVSGDFYWMTKKGNSLVVIAADCTGHGVPGAFMSMLGVSFLNEIVNRHDVDSAGAILTQLRADVKKTLGQEGKEGEAKDGMDIALCIIDIENMKMQYAGAYNPMYLFRNNELIETKADRMPIGIYVKEKESFTNNEIELKKDDVFYLFSDGFQDQFGGEDGSKYKTKNYKQLLLEIHQKPMAEQREILDTTIDKWRGKWEQVDDVIILGIRV